MRGGIKGYFANVKEKYKVKNHAVYYILGAFTVLFSVLSLTGGLKMSDQLLLEQIGCYVIFAVSLSLVVGFLGELSLGHAGFICLGAYAGTLFRNNLAGGLTSGAPLLSLIVAMLFGGIVAALAGLLIGLPALRLKGDYLAIVTLAFGEIVKTLFTNIPLFGGPLGLSNRRYDRATLFIVIFVTAIASVAIVNNFIRSKHGRAVTAIRDNEIAARAMGVNVTFYKLAVFVLSSFLAGAGGAALSASSTQITADGFNYNYSINILVMVVLGGMGSINGSILAAAAVTLINVQLKTALSGNLAALKDMIYALILIGIVIYNNAPRLKSFREKHNLRRAAEKLRVFFRKLLFKKPPTDDPAEEKAEPGDWSNIPTKVPMDAILSTDLSPDTGGEAETPDKPGKSEQRKGEK